MIRIINQINTCLVFDTFLFTSVKSSWLNFWIPFWCAHLFSFFSIQTVHMQGRQCLRQLEVLCSWRFIKFVLLTQSAGRCCNLLTVMDESSLSTEAFWTSATRAALALNLSGRFDWHRLIKRLVPAFLHRCEHLPNIALNKARFSGKNVYWKNNYGVKAY